MSTDYNEIPIPTIKRLPSYLRLLKAYREEGMEMISATLLADELGLKPIQVRKDISCTGIEGKPKVGFSVNGLIDAIIEALGWDNAPMRSSSGWGISARRWPAMRGSRTTG